MCSYDNVCAHLSQQLWWSGAICSVHICQSSSIWSPGQGFTTNVTARIVGNFEGETMDFKLLWLFVKLFSTKFGAVASFGSTMASGAIYKNRIFHHFAKVSPLKVFLSKVSCYMLLQSNTILNSPPSPLLLHMLVIEYACMNVCYISKISLGVSQNGKCFVLMDFFFHVVHLS